MPSRFFDLSAPDKKLRVTGADQSFIHLNGQTTNDVRKASPNATQESCVLNSKGHLDAHIFLFAVPNEIWIDTEAELREQLQGRIERYIIADDVLVEDAGGASLCSMCWRNRDRKGRGQVLREIAAAGM